MGGGPKAYTSFMSSARTGLLALALLVCAPRVGAEEPSPCPPGGEVDQRGFDVAMARFTRLWEVTQRLVAEHALAFEHAAERYERYVALTRELTLRHEAEEEQAFDDSVALYLRKRALTQALAREHAVHEPR